MKRPSFITDDQILCWSQSIDNDPLLPKGFKELATLREVIYSGMWLKENLDLLGANEEHVLQMGYCHGQLSFGRDCWEIAQDLLNKYKNGQIEFDRDFSQEN